VSPQNKTRGRVAQISNLATSGTQNTGKPSAHEGWKTLTPEQPPSDKKLRFFASMPIILSESC
jgi:hypothetical protein